MNKNLSFKGIIILFLLFIFNQNILCQYNPETNSYTGEISASNNTGFGYIKGPLTKSNQLNCNDNYFWAINSSGKVSRFILNGNQVTLDSVISTTSPGKSIAICNNFNGGKLSPTIYEANSNVVYYYDGNSSWKTVSQTASTTLYNGGGHGDYLYFQDGSQHSIVKYNGTFSVIYTYISSSMAIADLAADADGNVWCPVYGSPSPNIKIDVISPSGTLIKSYNFKLNTYNAYGCFMLNNKLYIGLGSSHPEHPNTLLPITFTQDTAIAETPIPMPVDNWYDLASCKAGATSCQATSFTKQPIKAEICNRDSAIFSVSAEGDGTITFKWQVNDGSWKDLADGGSSPSYKGSNTTSLIIKNPVKDGLNYRCIISNCSPPVYATSNQVALSVASPVAINPSFHNQSQCLNDSIGFTLNPTSGTGPFSYQWMLNGKNISGGTSSLYFKPNISNSDSGKYSCVITNACNSVTGDVVSLTPINCVRFRHKITGYIKYNNPSLAPMSSKTALTVTNVYLYNSGDTLIDMVQTDDNGYYEFVNVINGTYYVTGSTNKQWGGSNPVDALWINRDYIGVVSISDILYRQAGDPDNNQKLNPKDALMVNRRYIGILKKFPIEDWIFEKQQVEMQGADLRQDIKAICSGDVNGSYNPPY